MTFSHIRFQPDTDLVFRQMLNARVGAYLSNGAKSQFADYTIWLKGAFYAIATVGFYIAVIIGGAGLRGTLIFAILYGLSALLLAMNIAHDAAHTALTGNRAVDSAIHRILFGLVGVDGYLWQMRHRGSHHVFPNVNGCDIDIDENPFLRLSPNHPWKVSHRNQHIYAIFFYFMTLIHSIYFGDFVYLRKRNLANMRDIQHKSSDLFFFFIFKLAYIGINLGVPLVLLPFAWWQILTGYVVMTAAMSVVFVFLLIGTHFSSDADFPLVDGNGRLDAGWAAHAIRTSVDWLPESRVVLFFAGGANAHAAHHLFPRISHAHYIPITRIVRATAEEFGFAHHETTFFGMLQMHFRHLRTLGDGMVCA